MERVSSAGAVFSSPLTRKQWLDALDLNGSWMEALRALGVTLKEKASQNEITCKQGCGYDKEDETKKRKVGGTLLSFGGLDVEGGVQLLSC